MFYRFQGIRTAETPRMATDQVRTKASRNEGFVASQLARVEQRIRRVDVAAGVLCLLALTLFWFVLSAILHRWLDLAAWVRVLGLLGCAGAIGYALYHLVWRPWRRPLNPLYPAFLIERQLPDARNSVASFLDLRQSLPGTLRQALGLRAARDLKDMEPERAVSARPVIGMSVLAGTAIAAIVASLLVLGVGPFLAVLWPFSSAPISPPFRLAVVRPDGGDAVLLAGRPLTILVLAENVPDSQRQEIPYLLFRYQADAPDSERHLRPQGDGRHWTVTLPAADVRAGFSYRVRGFGAETPTYHVMVRANPSVADFRATYHYRPYVGRVDRTSTERNLEALCGTQVILRVRTDRQVKTAFLDLQRDGVGKETIPAHKVADDPQSFEVKFTLDRSGSYRMRFTTEGDESYADADASGVIAVPDRAPSIELTEPRAEESTLPADGLLRVAGKVRDDIGVAGVKLRLRVVKGEALPDRPLKPALLALDGGGNRQAIDFLDSVDLAKLRASVAAGVIETTAELEGWLEARDGCDFLSPDDAAVPHIVESRHFRVRLVPPDPATAGQRDKEKRQAEVDKKKHDRDQDEQRRAEEEARQKEGQQPDPGDNNSGKNQANAGNQGNQDNKDTDTAKQAQQLLDQLGKGKPEGNQDKQDQNSQPSPGEGKGEPQPGSQKDGPDGKQGTQQDGQHGDAKGQEGANGQQPGMNKDPGKQGAEDKPGSEKGDGGMSGGNGPGEGKGQGPGKADGPEGKAKPDASGPTDPGSVKGGPPAGPDQPGTGKPAPGAATDASAAKPAGAPGDAPPAQARGADDSGTRGTSRGDGGAPPGSEGANKGGMGQAGKVEAKPGPGGQDGRDATAQSKPEKPQADVTPEEVRRRIEDLQAPNPAKQAEAARDLEDAAANAKNPEARQEARDALVEEGLLPPDMKPAEGKGRAPGGANPMGEAEGQAKDNGPGQPGSQPAEGKGGGSPNQGTAKDNGGDSEGKGKGGAAKAGTVANPMADRPDRNDRRSPQQAARQRATVLQLYSAKELLTREQLQKAGFKDDAAYRRFLADCEALLRRPRPARTNGQETLPSAQSGAGLPSLSSKPSVGGTTSDLRTSDQGQPPPGYQRAYDEFTRKLRQMP